MAGVLNKQSNYLHASDDLRKISDQISVSFLPKSSSVWKNCLERGLNYYAQGYIHEIKVFEDTNAVVRVDAEEM